MARESGAARLRKANRGLGRSERRISQRRLLRALSGQRPNRARSCYRAKTDARDRVDLVVAGFSPRSSLPQRTRAKAGLKPATTRITLVARPACLPDWT